MNLLARKYLIKHGLWYVLFVVGSLDSHKSHAKLHHDGESERELEARAIYRLAWKQRKSWQIFWLVASFLGIIAWLHAR